MTSPATRDAESHILRVLNQLGRELMRPNPTETILPRILSAATVLLPVAVCLLWRFDGRRALQALRLEASWGTSERQLLPRRLLLSASISRRALDLGRCQPVADLLTTDSAEAGLARDCHLASLICVPVLPEAGPLAGIFQAYTADRHDFAPVEVQIAEALGLAIGDLWLRTDLSGQVQQLKADLKTRKQVERAKEILMDQRRMTAEEAYRWIQKRSMDTRRSMREVAEIILHAEMSGHYSSIPHALDFSRKPPRR